MSTHWEPRWLTCRDICVDVSKGSSSFSSQGNPTMKWGRSEARGETAVCTPTAIIKPKLKLINYRACFRRFMACAARWRCASRWRLQTVGGAPRTALPHGMLQVDARCPHRDSSVDEKSSVVFEVVFNRVVVRAEPSTRSEALAAKNKGELITAVRECAGWVLLKQRFHGREGWMLIDGSALGMGRLLQRVSALPSRRHALAFNAEHVTLRTGVRMPLLGLGTGGVPGLEGEVAVRLVAHALRHCGVRLVDTASAYHNEEAVGEGIRQSGVPREEVFIITKVAPLEQVPLLPNGLCPRCSVDG